MVLVQQWRARSEVPLFRVGNTVVQHVTMHEYQKSCDNLNGTAADIRSLYRWIDAQDA